MVYDVKMDVACWDPSKDANGTLCYFVSMHVLFPSRCTVSVFGQTESFTVDYIMALAEYISQLQTCTVMLKLHA